MKNRALWKGVFKNTFTYYSRLNFRRTQDPDDLLEYRQRSVADAISDQEAIPAEEKFGVYMKLSERYPHASASTKKKWKRRMGL